MVCAKCIIAINNGDSRCQEKIPVDYRWWNRLYKTVVITEDANDPRRPHPNRPEEHAGGDACVGGRRGDAEGAGGNGAGSVAEDPRGARGDADGLSGRQTGSGGGDGG